MRASHMSLSGAVIIWIAEPHVHSRRGFNRSGIDCECISCYRVPESRFGICHGGVFVFPDAGWTVYDVRSTSVKGFMPSGASCGIALE